MLKPIKRKFRESEDNNIVDVDGEKLDAETAVVLFDDVEKDIQVVASPDPENENSVTVAVLTCGKDTNIEDETVLGAMSVEGSSEEGAEESKKAERREAFRKRLEARRAERKNGAPARNEARGQSFRERLEARRAAKKSESKAPATRIRNIQEARAKFRSKLGKKA